MHKVTSNHSVNGFSIVKNGQSTLRKVRYHNETNDRLPEILFINSYPPRECGIATYSQDLIKALNNTFSQSFKIVVCPLEAENEEHIYPSDIEYSLNTCHPIEFIGMAKIIDDNDAIKMVVIQHEFSFFRKRENLFMKFIQTLSKPVIIVFHTVLPRPDEVLKNKVINIAAAAESIVVMTNGSAKILMEDYGLDQDKIIVISHGTHLIAHENKEQLKERYDLSGRTILSTFGLLGPGKSIETTLDALPAIIKKNPDVLFLIIGKTHPSVMKQEGETYRYMLKEKIDALHLQRHVQFINLFLPLHELLEYLQLTDIYLFTSKDPNQAVSGTFSYAMSCGCPVVSTPIPHAVEVVKNNAGVLIEFGNSTQLASTVNELLEDDALRNSISSNGLHLMASTAWENAAIGHARLFQKVGKGKIKLYYDLPEYNLQHIKNMTTGIGIIQFANINEPDIESGYTLDDNARAMIALCQHYELTGDKTSLEYINLYYRFIKFCLQPDGRFLNYVDENKKFTKQNKSTNLEDSNGRAIWALGYLVSLSDILPKRLVESAKATMQAALYNVHTIHSTRAMAFVIKGLYYANEVTHSETDRILLQQLANRMLQMYRHESDSEWQWFESYLTYANSLLPEAMLCAWMVTDNPEYKEVAKSSFDFLLSKTFVQNSIKVISNQSWLHNGQELKQVKQGGEQPIDVAYTILALGKFYDVFQDPSYLRKLKSSFDWFLGDNHLQQIMYNPITGGCYDGLEEHNVNLNQGAESTVSYLMARLVVEKALQSLQTVKHDGALLTLALVG